MTESYKLVEAVTIDDAIKSVQTTLEGAKAYAMDVSSAVELKAVQFDIDVHRIILSALQEKKAQPDALKQVRVEAMRECEKICEKHVYAGDARYAIAKLIEEQS